jgi:hypothetical protein
MGQSTCSAAAFDSKIPQERAQAGRWKTMTIAAREFIRGS